MATTADLYAGAAAGLTGTWSNITNAQGSIAGTFATCAISAANASCSMETSAHAAQAAVPAGATINSVNYRVRYSFRSSFEFNGVAAIISSMTAQLYAGATQKASNSIVPATFTDGVEANFTVTGISYAELADLRVRVNLANNGSAGITRTIGVDWARLVVDYTSAAPASSSFFPFF